MPTNWICSTEKYKSIEHFIMLVRFSLRIFDIFDSYRLCLRFSLRRGFLFIYFFYNKFLNQQLMKYSYTKKSWKMSGTGKIFLIAILNIFTVTYKWKITIFMGSFHDSRFQIHYYKLLPNQTSKIWYLIVHRYWVSINMKITMIKRNNTEENEKKWKKWKPHF